MNKLSLREIARESGSDVWKVNSREAVIRKSITTIAQGKDLVNSKKSFSELYKTLVFELRANKLRWVYKRRRLRVYNKFIESLILAQDERWRRA